jgi:Domain of unknown function (DUF5659)
MNIIKLKDFYLSAFLVANGFELLDQYRSHGYTTFFFEETEELNKLVKSYNSLKAVVEPVKYSQALRTLKGVIHSLTASTLNHGTNNNGSTSK